VGPSCHRNRVRDAPLTAAGPVGCPAPTVHTPAHGKRSDVRSPATATLAVGALLVTLGAGTCVEPAAVGDVGGGPPQ